MNYPMPDENPVCQCQGNPGAAFFCSTGHLMECHFPYGCRIAACSHLIKYGFSRSEIEELEASARIASESGNLQPYTFDADGNAIVSEEDHEHDPPAD